MGLASYWLRTATKVDADGGMLKSLCFTCGVTPELHGEKRVGMRSRLKLG